jgi:broad specificity phosphatase PhoE
LKNTKYKVLFGVFLAIALAWQTNGPASAQTTGAVNDEATATEGNDELIQKLQAGGYVIYLRHTETDSATEDSDLSDMSDCSKQRLLSEEGRENAKQIGEAFKSLKIPVASVTTSLFCRAKETAALMGFDKAVETGDIDNDSGEPKVTKEESERRTAALRKLLADAEPPAGQNILIVGHVPNIRNAVALEYAKMKEGELAVFAPADGEPGYEPVGRIMREALLESVKSASK